MYGRLRAQPAQCVYPTVNQLLQSPGSLAPTEADMRRRDIRSLRAASGDGERLTFDFILNSYTRYRATGMSQPSCERGEQIARRNKSIFVLRPRELNEISSLITRETVPEITFQRRLTRTEPGSDSMREVRRNLPRNFFDSCFLPSNAAIR